MQDITLSGDAAGDRLLSLKQAADRLGCTVRTIYNRAGADPLFPILVKFGASTKVRARDLDGYIAGLTAGKAGQQ